MPKSKPGTKKSAAKSAKPVSSRRLRQSHYKSFRLAKRVKRARTKLPSAWKILRASLTIIRQNWKLLVGIAAVYALLTLVLVKGFSSSATNLNNLKIALHYGNGSSPVATGVSLVGYLFGTAGSSNTPAGSVYQVFLAILVSLVTIWALRQILAGRKVKVKESYYKGVYPLIPFILVLLVIGLQLLPLAIGSWLYTAVVGGGLAVTFLEKALWTIFFFLLSILSLYMISSSVFALYIVTLPNMTPLKALRSARQLVLHRRAMIIRKLIYLPVILFTAELVLMVPVVLILTPIAEWLFFVISMFVLVLVHTYMYSLYRELL